MSKRIFAILTALFAVLAACPTADASISFVNSASYNDSTGSATRTSTPMNTSAGNFITGCISVGGHTVQSITDTASDTFITIASNTDNAQLPTTYFVYAKNISAQLGNVITVTQDSTANSSRAAFNQYSGMDTTAPLDVNLENESTSVFILQTSGNFSTNFANELLFSCINIDNVRASSTESAGGGYALESNSVQSVASGSSALWTEDRIVSSIQTNTSATWGGFDRWRIYVGTFKQQVAASSPVGPFLAWLAGGIWKLLGGAAWFR